MAQPDKIMLQAIENLASIYGIAADRIFLNTDHSGVHVRFDMSGIENSLGFFIKGNSTLIDVGKYLAVRRAKDTVTIIPDRGRANLNGGSLLEFLGTLDIPQSF